MWERTCRVHSVDNLNLDLGFLGVETIRTKGCLWLVIRRIVFMIMRDRSSGGSGKTESRGMKSKGFT